MNQDTNRPAWPEQERESDAAGRSSYEDGMRLPPQNGYRPQPYAPFPAGNEPQRKKPWHSQGWLWLIVTVVGVGAVVIGLLTLAGEIGGIGTALREQTEVMREQSGLLNRLGDQLGHLIAAVNRVADSVRDAVSHWLASM